MFKILLILPSFVNGIKNERQPTLDAFGERRETRFPQRNFTTSKVAENLFAQFTEGKQQGLLARLVAAPVINQPGGICKESQCHFLHNCELSEKSFEGKSTPETHEHFRSEVKKYACGYCGKQFKQSFCVKEHKAAAHCGEGIVQKEQLHLCPVCGKLIVRETAFLKHMRGHSIKNPFHCEMCGKAFSRLDNLGRHQKRNHLGSKSVAALCD
ncbi:hypothetical protein CRM22_009078 [Opisthorchis felineus]|uniref:C2H2-type domain-containing protein n=1 Tax=Opisthorchis felineus TaxID=147828 RepID=A0A4S2LGE1_OPIFE|nr:hypothetical protein CRM22_009078 [Opisthorchis felineus]